MGVRRNYMLGVVLLGLSAVSAPAVAGNDDLVNAMMEVYAEELAANPQDYRTYYSRSMAYFGKGDMEKALSDINNAIKYFPRREKDDLAQAYLLRAKILTVKGENKPALTDLNSALRLVPNHRLALKDRGDLLCKMGQYDLAKIDYSQLLRMDTRSQSAYMGLARVEAHIGQPVRAKDLLAQAVNLSPKDPAVYLERSEIYKEMGLLPEAVDDLVYAVSLDDGRSGAIQQLVAYSNEAYSEVIAGLNRNIGRFPRQGMLYYVRGSIYKERTSSTSTASTTTGPIACRVWVASTMPATILSGPSRKMARMPNTIGCRPKSNAVPAIWWLPTRLSGRLPYTIRRMCRCASSGV